MIESEKEGHFVLLRVALPYLLLTVGYASIVLVIEEILGDHVYSISGQVGSVFGLAVAFFLGFRMNSAYDRWWEARKIVGELTNNTRSFANKVYTYYSNAQNLKDTISNGKQEAQALLELLRAYVLQFRAEMGGQPSDPSLQGAPFSTQYGIESSHKLSNELLLAISMRIETAMAQDSRMEKNDLMLHINRFYEIQGKAERIRDTPFLLIYSAFTRIVVMTYVFLTPLLIGDIDLGGEDSGLEFLSVPILGIIGASFLIINRLANLYGAPFSSTPTSIPMQQICQRLVQNIDEVVAKCKGWA